MKIKPNYTKISQILCVTSILIIVAWKSLEQQNYIGHSYKSIASDPLPSWNDGEVKKSIIDFVSKVIQEGGANFIPANDRIATFDNDGTLWAEHPMYFQLLFAIDRIGLWAFTLWTRSDDKTRINEWLREKKLAAISCSPYASALMENSLNRNDEFSRSGDRSVGEHKSTNRCPPLDPKNGNGCSHQQGSLCETNYSRRKILKTCNC